MSSNSHTVLGLDIGSKRIGVARGSTFARLAEPLSMVMVDGTEQDQLRRLIEQENAQELVVGLPRGLEGQETQQTRSVREFTNAVLAPLGLPLRWQDEAGTSKEAAARLAQTKNSRQPNDAVAAALILQDYFDTLAKPS